MSDYTMCAGCGTLMDDIEGAICKKCAKLFSAIEPDAPTDATLGDALYERAEAVEEALKVGDTVLCQGHIVCKVEAFPSERMVTVEVAVPSSKRLHGSHFSDVKRSDVTLYIDPRARIAQLEAELAQAKARLAKIDAAYDKCAALAETSYLDTHEYDRQWGVRLEQLFTTVATSQEAHS